MKVVCIDAEGRRYNNHYGEQFTTFLGGRKISGRTAGKIYDVIDSINSSPWVLQIVDDNGEKHWFNEEFLMPIEKYRELQLKELGI